ncbi:Solute Carrier Family 22 Member 3, partial [Manis pentadactyla]
LYLSFLISNHLVLPGQVQVLLALEQDRKETKFQAACLSKFTKDWTDDTYLCW